MNQPQNELLEDLNALRRAVEVTATLKTILDNAWFNAVETAIGNSPSGSTLGADPSGFLYEFRHPLRGVDWFEEAQKVALHGRVDALSEDSKFALWIAGIDPLRTVLPLIESRLQALESFKVKPDKVKMKLQNLRAARGSPSFRNHLFELGVLGNLALKKVLVDIEEATTAVDGVINIDGRDILVEATNTVQQVIPDFVGMSSVDANLQIDQVVYKLHKKVAEGRQLARANGKPTLLFLARTRLGADRMSAQIALRECFSGSDFSALSGVVLADSWKFYATSWHPGVRPDVPLTDTEGRRLSSWYGRMTNLIT